MTKTTLAVRDLSVSYGSVRAVRSASFSCRRGEIVALLGSNGAGKSSTLNAIAGICSEVTGSVEVDGRAILGSPPERVASSGVSLVPQARRIFQSLSVKENLLVPLAGAARSGTKSPQRLAEVMDRFPDLKRHYLAPARRLSGGEQQQLAIARALLLNPRFVLLDEPSLGLAPRVVNVVFEIVRSLGDAGLGVVLVEQKARRAARLADRVLLMRHGEISEASELDDEQLVSSYLGPELGAGR